MANPDTDSFGDIGVEHIVDRIRNLNDDIQQNEENISNDSEAKEMEDKSDQSEQASRRSSQEVHTGINVEDDTHETKSSETPPPISVTSALSAAPMRLPPIKVTCTFVQVTDFYV